MSALMAAYAARPKVKIKSDVKTATQAPVITAMTVTVGLGGLRAWLVDRKPVPDAEWFIQMAILGFGLSLLAETLPKLGKSMSYLVLTAAVFAQAGDILEELDPKSKTNRKRATKRRRANRGKEVDDALDNGLPDTIDLSTIERLRPMGRLPALPR